MADTDRKTGVAEVLERAAVRLSKRGAWCKGGYAKNAAGAPVPPSHPDAKSFCMMGAIRWAVNDDEHLARKARGLILQLLPHDTPAWFNDKPSRRKWQVVAKLREATRLSKGVS